MEKYLGIFLPTMLIVICAGIIFCIVHIWQWKKRKKKNPLTIKLLRAPGESLIAELDSLNLDIAGYLVLTFVLPLLFLCLHLSESYIGNIPETTSRYIINILGMFLTTAYFMYKLYDSFIRRDNYRLGYDAERATGQELNKLVAVGYKVFHDIPCDKFNIDHVVVGKNGIFVIETKGRAKNKTENGKNNSKVIYDGSKLNFPLWTEVKPIEQVKSATIWLSRELSSAVGETIKVHPVLSIPGWYIVRKSNSAPSVYNGKNPEYIIPKIKNQELSDQLIRRVTHQLERLINDVSPKAYNEKVK